MVKALFDANILIDYLRGIEAARTELGRYEDKAISAVTWMEVLAGALPPLVVTTRDFLDSFNVVPIDTAVAERAVALRQAHRMKLPDAIVWASAQAQAQGRLLVTWDTKGLPLDNPGVRVPYGVPIAPPVRAAPDSS